MLVQPGVTGRAIRFGFLPLLPRHHAMRARARIGIGADPHGIDRAENAAAVGLAAADDVAPPAAALEDFHLDYPRLWSADPDYEIDHHAGAERHLIEDRL
jgi:hypothetical protein